MYINISAKGNLVAGVRMALPCFWPGDIGPEAGKPVMKEKVFCSKFLPTLMFLILSWQKRSQTNWF